MGIKYKVVDKRHINYGKIIKAIPDDNLVFTDIKTGETYDIGQLSQVPEKHAVYGGLHIGRFGLFLFGREYFKYHSFQFGVSFDLIHSGDVYFDIEARIACFGFGIRFVWLEKLD